jgi:hypothetical protein
VVSSQIISDCHCEYSSFFALMARLEQWRCLFLFGVGFFDIRSASLFESLFESTSYFGSHNTIVGYCYLQEPVFRKAFVILFFS